jgi:hypothetical protein
MTTRILCVIGVALMLSGCGSSETSSYPPPSSTQYEEPFPVLNAYGNWIDLAAYGRVWQPAVGSDWAPFVNGTWIWTDEGWMWDTSEPYGWVVYHYGYWMRWGATGWVWVPDYEWSPARVRWYDDGVNIGWSPMPPPRSSFPMAYEQGFEGVWVFVPSNRFINPNVGAYRYASPPPQGGRRPLGVTRGPDLREVERRSNMRIAPRSTASEKVRNGPRTVTRVRVTNDDNVRPVTPQPRIAPADQQPAPPLLPSGARQSGDTRVPPPAAPAPSLPVARPVPKPRTPPVAKPAREKGKEDKPQKPADPPKEEKKERK